MCFNRTHQAVAVGLRPKVVTDLSLLTLLFIGGHNLPSSPSPILTEEGALVRSLPGRSPVAISGVGVPALLRPQLPGRRSQALLQPTSLAGGASAPLPFPLLTVTVTDTSWPSLPLEWSRFVPGGSSPVLMRALSCPSCCSSPVFLAFSLGGCGPGHQGAKG